MLVKLAFVMQRLKNYLKKIFCHDQQRWGDTAVMRGHRVHGRIRPVPSPPTRKNPGLVGLVYNNSFWSLCKSNKWTKQWLCAWEYDKGKKLKETMAQDSTDFHYIKGRLKDQFCLL